MREFEREPEGVFRDSGAAPPAAGRPSYVVTLRPEPGVDGTRALRAMLKTALRRFGLRCVGLRTGE